MAGSVTACRSCGGRLTITMADLGMQPPSNAFLASPSEAAGEKRYPLRAKVCEICKLVQVDFDVAPEELFGNYVYFSSYSEDWLAHALRYADMARRRFDLGPESLVVELASNDGYLLKNFLKMGIPVLGIDPSDTVARAAEGVGVPTLVEFFGETLGRKLAHEGRGADLIVANNVLAHVPQLNDFVAGIAALLKPGGNATIEFPHLLKLIENVEFDTIYHEHYSYLSLTSVEHLFSRHGLRVYDVEELSTHGGRCAFSQRMRGARSFLTASRCGHCARRKPRRDWASSTPTGASRTTWRPAGARCKTFSPGHNANRSAWRRTGPQPRETRCSTSAVSRPGILRWWRTAIRTSKASSCPAPTFRSYRRRR